MARNVLVINCDLRETRVALIENGVIAELQIERAGARSTVGNIVLGKVTRVLPGMQAAFIDVGMERAAFLHVEDLIRPDDFEAYLAGARREEDEAHVGRGEGGRLRGRTAPGPARNGLDENGADDEDDEDEDEDDELEEDEDQSDEPTLVAVREVSAGADDQAADSEPTPSGDGVASDVQAAANAEEDEDDKPLVGALAEGVADAEIEITAPVATAGATALATETIAVARSVASDRFSRRRRRRRGGRGDDRAERGRRDDRKKHDERRKAGTRVSRSVPITDVVKEGDQVIVQISKEPIGTKGARVTSHVSLPGRYVVYLPTVEHVGISKRIGSLRERGRLREVVESMKPPSGGLVVRTVAEGLTKKALKNDIGYLVRLWSDVSKKRANAKAPTVLYADLDLVLKTARDLFTEDIQKIVLDDRDQYARLVRFVEMFMPERVKDIELYSGDEPIFDAYGIEDEIGRALSRKVPLPSGGYLIIDQAEALTAIDVNTGRFVGKGSKDLEETALKTNLEAVDEIAYQLRFRNIGGLVILDLIDMDIQQNRDRVWRALEAALAHDKAKTTLNRISELGLIEMTRKRTRESLSRVLHESCFYCDGTGQIQSRTTIAYEILRQIRRERHMLPGYSVVVNAHPAIVDVMQGEEKAAVAEAERRYMRRIEFNARREYHIEQFDLQGK
jgi:ribonuclease G